MTQHASEDGSSRTGVRDAPDTAVLEHLGPTLEGESLPSALVPVLGRSPFQRHVSNLAALGFGRCVVVVDAGQTDLVGRCKAQLDEIAASAVSVEFVSVDSFSPDGSYLRACGHGVYDPRLYRAVLEVGGPATLVEDHGAPSDLDREVGLEVRGSARNGSKGSVPVRVDAVDAYLPSLRRHLAPFAHRIRSEAEREAAAHALLNATQKGVLDFPARFVHPPIENTLTRRLAGTGITPNQITVFTGILGFAVAALFATERYGLGLAIAFLVNVLDGVDGKLARVKLLASRFGDRLDHFLDVTFEFSWYLGLGWGLSAGDTSGAAFRAGGALILVMLAARAMSGVYKLVTGRQIHDHREFDRAFRLVAGRRNVYVFVLIGGALTGNVREAFFACLAWGVVTLMTYTFRTVMEAVTGSWPKRAPIEDR